MEVVQLESMSAYTAYAGDLSHLISIFILLQKMKSSNVCFDPVRPLAYD